MQLGNHLGNVLTTISDRKIPVYSGSSLNLPGGFTVPIADYFEPDMVSATDYYPFGMVSRGVGPSDKYRFGFNGKENDNEVKGFAQQQDYGMRIYDPRVGRFLSVDPITKEYPELTPYQFASNSPIASIDLDGEESKVITHVFGTSKTKPVLTMERTDNNLPKIIGIHYEVHQQYKIQNGQVLSRSTFAYEVNESTGKKLLLFGGLPKVTSMNGTLFDFGLSSTALKAVKGQDQSMVFGKKVSAGFRIKISKIATSLGTDVNYLMTIMAFETGGSFSPSQKNAAGSSATGLIQFMSFTAKRLGTTTDALSKMTAEGQLDYVEKYFLDYKGKLKTLEDAYMAVLWPAAVGKDLDHVMFNKYKTVDGEQVETLEYKQNSGLDTDGDDKITKKEVSAIIRKKYAEGEKKKN